MPRAALKDHPPALLIRRKLAPPPAPAPLLERPRLERQIAQLVERHPLVVVAATAGAGKTTAMSAAAAQLDRPLAWLSVDRTDVAPGRLLTYLEASLAQAVPAVAGVTRKALAEGLGHPEAVGVLAEAVGDAPVLLVLDDLERLGAAPEAWAVIDALLRYAPPRMRLVLVSRREIPAGVLSLPPGRMTVALTESALAFTTAEAAAALEMLGEEAVDAEDVVEATGGWVTGVLFESWRSAEHVAGVGGEADPLDGYLSSQVLEQLTDADREFLVVTSVLDEVTVARAAALGQVAAGERLAALKAAHLPVVWDADGATMRCHPRFREFLLKRLDRRDPDAVATVRIAFGRLLASEGHYEEATEELLRAGAPAQALEPAERAILAVLDRVDLSIAERWLAALSDVARGEASHITTAELMFALGGDDYRFGVRIADRVAEHGERLQLARYSDRAAALMASLYVGGGRLQDAHAVLDVADDGPGISIVRYMLGLYEQDVDASRPGPSGGPMDGVLAYADYFHGRLLELTAEPVSRWASAVACPWQIAAMCALGHTQEALDQYEEAERGAGLMPMSMAGYVGPEVLIDAGRRDQARDAIAQGGEMARALGARDLLLVNELMEAKLALRLDRDPVAGTAVLDRIARDPAAHEWPFISGSLHAWRGFALLLTSDDAAAVTQLRQAVEVMERAGLTLELPTAAAYLAEAEWRAGDEDAADRAADLALEASHRLGSNHRLLQALIDFPAVVSRRIDAERAADSPWHALGRALIAQGATVPTPIVGTIELREFGRATLVVDGESTRPRITKSYELLAYLVSRHGAPVERDELLDVLFDGRSDDSTRSYLRQAVYWVRRVLPDSCLIVEGRAMRLRPDLVVTSESARFETLLAEAARLQGAERLTATRAALALSDRGEYLPGARSGWAGERRRELADRAVDARCDAAELSLSAGRYREAQTLAEDALREDPLREVAWRLLMRIANALGDDDGALAALRGCEQALAAIGATPAPSTRRLLDALRR